MLSPRIAFHDLDPATWPNTQRLLLPPGQGRFSPLLLFIEGGRCVKAVRPGLPPLAAAQVAWDGPASLPRLRQVAGAPFALAVEDDGAERACAAFEAETDLREDLVAQGLALARGLKRELGRTIHIDPDPFRLLPVPSYAALQRTLDALLPDGRSAGLFVFDRGAVWASLIAEKRGGDVVRVTSHAALGPLPAGFRDGQHRRILEAVEARVARPHLCGFFTLAAWREVAGSTPGALARQVALREAVIDPAPPWLIALGGMGAMAGVAQGASRLIGRFVPQLVKDTARNLSPFTHLGFDPIALFVELRRIVERRG